MDERPAAAHDDDRVRDRDSSHRHHTGGGRRGVESSTVVASYGGIGSYGGGGIGSYGGDDTLYRELYWTTEFLRHM